MRTLIITFILFAFINTSFSQSSANNTNSKKPFVLGVIDEIQSGVLNEKRVLNIYLPEGYNENDTTKYPVVYLLDGSASEDFIHITGLYQFNNFPWIERVPKSIIVGIENVDRRRDFTYKTSIIPDSLRYATAGHSDKFISFIEKELQPYIEKNYRTTDTKTIIGQSLGGLVATEILFKKPSLFDKYIIISPSLWWDNGSLLNYNPDILKKDFTQKKDIYIGVGKEGVTPGDYPHVMEVDANLLAEKIKAAENNSLKVYFDYLPEENHATVTHQAVFNALRLLYPDVHKE